MPPAAAAIRSADKPDVTSARAVDGPVSPFLNRVSNQVKSMEAVVGGFGNRTEACKRRKQ